MSKANFTNINLLKYYLATSLSQFAFYIPIIQLFYLANNITIFNIAILGAVWSFVKIILEIPSSILADRWGRKNTMILSSIFIVFQLVILIYGSSFLFFLIASIFSAASYAFLSGTDIAFFYDNLAISKREHEFEKLWARQHIYQQIPLIIAFVSSGFLFKLSPRMPFQLSLIFVLMSFIIILTLKEPSYNKQKNNQSSFSYLKESVRQVFENKHLKFILVFTIFFSIASDISYNFGQIYLNYLSLPVILFGIVYTLKSILVTISSNIVPSLRKKFSYKNMFTFEIISITILLYLMILTNNLVIGVIGFILIAIPHGFFIITKSGYMHKLIKSHNRATIDSLFSFIVAIFIIIFELLTGWLADLYNIKISFFIVAIILSVYCLYHIFNRKKIK